MKTSDFDYHLPPNLIAQTPVEPRDASRLMLLNRTEGSIEHYNFFDLPLLLHPGDTMVFNDSRVMPARLYGKIENTSTNAELLLLRRLDKNIWEALARPGKKIIGGCRITIPCHDQRELHAEIIQQLDNGIRLVRFSDETMIGAYGVMPLPPYIHEPLQDPERYQTVYSRIQGSAAAPTAGLHFTMRLLQELISKEIKLVFVTLHIGLDTFRPVREEDPSNHRIHREFGMVNQETAEILNITKQTKCRIIAVGTSTARILEAASQNGTIKPLRGDIDLFILPGYIFKTVDAMITNFHLPKSTLLMLVSAFAGKELVFNAYQIAMQKGYRFYSFGDAMLIL